ncbi:MAG: WYL domain-containing protein [Balneolaceae bacterium]|nr:WYL domain-containing protein [Balneolaceae bacterium]
MPLNKNAYLRYQVIDECLRKKSMAYPSTEKLLEEIERLLDQRISRETLQKDIHEMKYSEDLEFRAPIRYSRARNGYYYEDKDYTIKAFPVDYGEMEAAEFALALLDQSGALPYLNRFRNFVEKALTFSRIESRLQGELSRYVQFDQPAPVEGLQWIEPLVDAIELRQVVDISYRAIRSDRPKRRLIHPYLLKEYDDRWYVYAYDELTGEERIFGLDRIRRLEVEEDADFRYFTGDREEVFRHTIGISRFVGDPEEIVLKFYYPQSEYVLSKPIHESQEVVERGEDTVTVRLFVRINYELKALVRSYGDRVKVVRPEGLGAS